VRAKTAIALLACLPLVDCNRAAVRIPGAALPLPATATHWTAARTHSQTIVVAMPSDLRPAHYGERVAGTRWAACRTDAFWASSPTALVRERLAQELRDSKLFARVSYEPAQPDDLVLHTELHAFCAQAVGVFFVRVAGITALRAVVERDGRPVFDRKVERVVTDADPEYTGAQVGTIERAMNVTMADSLREALRDLLRQLDVEAAVW
jgi:ABC-type uncharacterized transport system auxiliary subunit